MTRIDSRRETRNRCCFFGPVPAHQSDKLGETCLKHTLALVACSVALACTASAQLSSYLGPVILTGGADTIGSRGGEQLDLRFFADATAVYDNGLQPVSVDSKGDLVQIGGLYGVQADIGLYGSHSWRVALLGLDYKGDFREYVNNSQYDSSNHFLTLGYTYQKSRRLYFDFRGIGGLYSDYLGIAPGESAVPAVVTNPSLLLFDDRTYFLQGDASVTYLLSARASFTASGEGYTVQRQSSALVSMDGYGARGKFQYRLSRVTSVGVEYDRDHYQYQNFFGNSDINNYNAFVATQLGRSWTFSLSAGAYQVSTVGLQTVTLAPAIAALLGVSSTVHTFAADNWLPSGRATLVRKFKNASLAFAYAQAAAPGNGVYLSSRSDNGTATLSYAGVRKASINVTGGYAALSSIGQGIPPYQMFVGGAHVSYNLNHSLHAVAGYDVREQEIQVAGYRRTSYRASVGLAFSPGSLPLSLW